jgi:hypothetical protein
MTTLADDLVPDELWAIVKPLLPAPPRPPYGGRHRLAAPHRVGNAGVFEQLHLQVLDRLGDTSP